MDRVQDLGRNNIHQSIAERHGMERRIVFETYEEPEAFEKEVELIAELKTKASLNLGGANLTDGGEGATGCTRSEETKRKMSSAARIRETEKTQEEKERISSKISSVLKNFWDDEEKRKIMSETCKKALIDMADEKKIAMRMNLSKAAFERWAQMSELEKAEFSEKQKQVHERRSEDQKELIREKHKSSAIRMQANRTKEQRSIIRKKAGETLRKKEESLTKEQIEEKKTVMKEKCRQASLQRHANMSEEKRKIISEKQRTAALERAKKKKLQSN